MNVSGIFLETSYVFNTFTQSLPSAWSPPGTTEWRKIITAETRQRSKISSTFTFDQRLVLYGQTISEADFNSTNHAEERNLIMQVSSAFEQITVCHFNVWSWPITAPKISTIMYGRLLRSHLFLIAGNTCIYETEKHERRVLCKLQRGLTAVNSWRERSNVNINKRKSQAMYICRRIKVPDEVLQLNGRDVPFANSVTYLGVTFDRRRTPYRKHCSQGLALVFKSGRWSKYIKLTLYKTVIRSVITCTCPILEYAVDAHLLKLQRLQNTIIRAVWNFDRRTAVRELHVAFKIPYVYDCTTELCRTKSDVTINHVNPNVPGIGQGEVRYRNYQSLKPVGGQACESSAD
jgi:hypothetical protein